MDPWCGKIPGFPGGSAVKNPPEMQDPQKTWVLSLGQEDPLEEGTATHSSIALQSWTRPTALQIKNPPAKQEMQETWVQSLCREDPLEKEMANPSSILA